MPNLVPYINFGDKSQQAVAFYKTVFGGKAEVQAEAGRVMHLDFQAGDLHFMGGDHKSNEPGLGHANNYSVVLNCDSEAQLQDFYTKLVHDGKELFAPVDSGWGAIVAHCIDRFGVAWMLNYDKA